MIERFKDVLKKSGHSYTLPRQTVFERLLEGGPASATQLAQACHPTIDRATTYRTIDLFEQLGVVNRIWRGLESQVELSEIFMPHHHHATCQQCGVSIDLIDSELEKQLARVAKQQGFLALGHSIELTGYCQTCQISR